MEIVKTAIEGVVIIEPRLFKDERGYFFESFSQRDFDRQVRPIHFVQDNESKSSYGVLRGLHFQKPPFAQSKLVRVIKGAVLDVAVDIRKGSPSISAKVHPLSGSTWPWNSRKTTIASFSSRADSRTVSAYSHLRSSSNTNATISMPRKAKGPWRGTTPTSASTGEFPPTKSSFQKKTNTMHG